MAKNLWGASIYCPSTNKIETGGKDTVMNTNKEASVWFWRHLIVQPDSPFPRPPHGLTLFAYSVIQFWLNLISSEQGMYA